MNRLNRIGACAVVASALAGSNAMAVGFASADHDQDGDGAGGFIGFGVGGAPDYEGSDDYEAVPALFGQYNFASGRYVELGGAPSTGSAARLSFDIVPDDWSTTWELGPLLQYRLERDDVGNNRVDDMQKVDDAVEAGAFVGLNIGRFSAQLSAAADVSSEHKGYLVYLTGEYKIPITDAFSVTTHARLTYADSNYMDTYFGVNDRDALRSGLRPFDADGDLKDWGLGLTGAYQLNRKWGLVGNVMYGRLLNDAEDSPVTDDEGDETQVSGAVALTYAF